MKNIYLLTSETLLAPIGMSERPVIQMPTIQSFHSVAGSDVIWEKLTFAGVWAREVCASQLKPF
jgi:hypothetical protein